MNKEKRLSYTGLIALILTIAFFLAGANAVSVHAAAKPKLNYKELVMRQGATKTLNVKNKPAKAKVTFKSSNKSVASVSAQGKIKALKKGNAKITVTIKDGKKKTTLTCKVQVKKTVVVAVLDSGASAGVKVKKALSVTDANPRGPKGGHADNQIKRIMEEAPNAEIVSIRVTDSNNLIYSTCIADAVYKAIENKANIIYYSFYGSECDDDEYEAVKKAISKGIKIVAPAGNDHGKDARKMNWLTEEKGATVVGAYGTNAIHKVSNIHANIYIKANTTSAAAARYAGMLAAGKVYDCYYE